MNFSEQIKKLRKDNNLTQQEMADKLTISRQAVSNWENNKNLPDIEMLIIISQVFHISLDELILGEHNRNIAEKLIQDGSDNAKLKMNLLGVKIGGALMLLGFLNLILGICVPYSLEEYMGTAFTLMTTSGVVTFMIVGLKNIADLLRHNKNKHPHSKKIAIGGMLIFLGMIIYLLSLITEMVSSYLGFLGIAAGIILVIMGSLSEKQL